MNGDLVSVVAILALIVAGYVVTEFYALRETRPTKAEIEADRRAFIQHQLDELYASEQGKEPLP